MKILFATDGSASNRAAARFLSRLGHHRNVHVHQVIAPEGYQHDDGAFALHQAQELMGDFAGHHTRAAYIAGSTSEIVDKTLCTAEIVGADMIVVGARGQSAIERFLIGSVAEAVVRHARVPVLVGRLPQERVSNNDVPPPLAAIVVGVDGSPDATEAALFAATTLPRPFGCGLHLVTVLSDKKDTFGELPLTGTNETQYAEEVLSDLQTELENRGVNATAQVVHGDPATEIIAVAQRLDAGLIVVGSRGLNPVERLFLGSVSDRVLWHAPCSVLVCRTASERGDGELLP